MLACPVASCNLPLAREPGRVVCPRGHSFDIARSGYINLLQPGQRRSRRPGDTAEAVRARRRLHDGGFTRPLLAGIAGLLKASSREWLLDAGCGDGFYLGSIAEETGALAHGVDISSAAVDSAARRYPNCEWIVANADLAIPYSSKSFDAVLSITARRNPPEFRRVLRDGGRLLLALPAPDDLVELRPGGAGDRAPAAIGEFSSLFALTARERVTTRADLDAGLVADLLHSVYRPLSRERPRAMRVTFSLELLLFQPRDNTPGLPHMQ